MRRGRAALLLPTLALLLLGAGEGEEPERAQGPRGPNGFSLEGSTLPEGAIVAGGPPRDGIRSVDAPSFAPPEEARWAKGGNLVLGVALGDEVRAYPVHLLEWHQVVNDEIGGVPVVVTFDPLAGVPRAYRRQVDGRTLEFGVSGLVHNSNFLLYDRETGSLWLQWTGRAVAGELAGRRLEPVTIRQEILDVWAARHEGRQIGVLRPPEPERIDYRHSPYKAYWVSEKVPFPVAAEDDRYHPKELVVGVELDGVERAYLGSILTAAGGRARDRIAGKPIQVDYDTNLAAFAWDVPEGAAVTESYWFAWKAFHPDTEVWQPPDAQP